MSDVLDLSTEPAQPSCTMCEGRGVIVKQRPKGAMGPRESWFACPCRWRSLRKAIDAARSSTPATAGDETERSED